MPDTRRETVDELFRLLTDRRYADLDRVLADDAVFDVAYYPADAPGPNPTVGRAAVRQMFADVVAAMFDPFEFRVVECYLGADPEIAVVEYTTRGTARPTKRPYENRYVGIMRIGNGKVRLWREYHNPEQMAASFGNASGRR